MAAKSPSHWPITLTNGTASIFNIILPLGLVRILSPDQVGIYSVFFLYVAISPGLFLTGGLTSGLYHWAGKYPGSKPEVRQSWTLLAAVALIVSLVGLIFSQPLAARLKITVMDLRLFLTSVPFVIGSGFMEDLMIARGDIWMGSFYGSGFNFFRAVSLLVAAWWTRSVKAMFWAFFAVTALRALVGWFLLRKSDEIKLIFSKDKTGNVLRFALPVSLSGASSMAVRSADQMILSFLLSPVNFAFYSMGCLSIQPLEILESSVNRVMIPRLSRAFTAKEFSQAAALFAEGVSELFRFLMPATVGLIVFSRPIIQILFTQRYMAAAGYLQFYALTYLFLSIPYDAVARARADGGWILRTYLLFSLLGAPVAWFAALRWGAMGALITVLANQFLMRLYSLNYDRRCFNAPLSDFLPMKEMLIQSGLALAAAAISILLRPLFSDPRTWFFVIGPLFTLIYFGGIYGLFLRRFSTAVGPIHVLELTQTLCLGGLERSVFSLAQTLNQNHRFKVLVASYDHFDGQPSLAPQFKEADIPLMQWEKGKGFSLRSVIRLVRLIYAEHTRILHVHDLGPLVYGSLARLLSFGRVRLILTQHNRLLDIQRTPRYRFYYKFFLRFPDRIVAVSDGVRSGLVELGVSPERIEVVPNGASFSHFRGRTGESLDKAALRKQIIPSLAPELYGARWLICLARLNPGKGQDVVLDVWSALPDKTRSQLALFFVGQESDTAYAEALRRKAQALPDANRIIFAGPSEHPQEWLQCADVFISGSLNEGMPLAPLEAAGSGLPALLSDIEGHQFLKPWAHTFDPGNPKNGADKILDILDLINRNGDMSSLEIRWEKAAPLREKWGASSMTDSYAEIFSGV